MLRSLGLLVAVPVLVVACSAPPPAKNELVVCQAGEDGCPSTDPPNRTKRAEADPPNTTPEPAPSPSPAPAEDAGTEPTADAAPPEPGALCQKLQSCCDDLKAQGYDPATCEGVVQTLNENACYAQHQQYKNFGDCS